MNSICKVVWSHVHQQLVVVSELVKSGGKTHSSRSGSRSGTGAGAAVRLRPTALALSMAMGLSVAQAQVADNALPTGGSVAAGTASISSTTSSSGANMVINQSSQRAVINWQSFNVGKDAHVQFNNGSGSTLNRVTGPEASTILGRISATGQVVISNGNGVFFGQGSRVDVGSLVATTHSIGNEAFMAGGDLRFERNGATGSVVNEGELSASLQGYVALLAPEVRNSGVIVASKGTVALAAGEAITLQLNTNDQLQGVVVEAGDWQALVDNRHVVEAEGGLVILSARALQSVQGGVVRHSGSLSASSLTEVGGRILLTGDDITLAAGSSTTATGATGGGQVLVGGDWQGGANAERRVFADPNALHQATTVTMEQGATIDASATDNGKGGTVVLWSDVSNANSVTTASGAIYAKGGANGGDGGQIETSGAKLITDGVTGSAAAPNGKAGEWLFDPYNIEIVSSGTESFTNNSNTLTGTDNDSKILNTSINNLLDAGTNVTVSTTGAGGQTGDILVSSAISANASSTASLSLIADGTVTLNANIAVGGNVSITTTGLSGTGGISLVSGKALTVNQSGDSIYGGVISGEDASLVKDGAGVLTLSADHTYKGSTTISSGGTLQVGNGGATGSLATSNVVNNGNLVFYTGADQTIPYVISGTGGVEVKGGEDTIFNLFLTNSNQSMPLATGKTVLDVLERIAGGQQGGTYINCQTSGVTTVCGTIPAGAYNKKYDAATDTATFQIQSYFNGGQSNQYTKVVFVKLSPSDSGVAVSSYQGRGLNYAVYKAGNHLGTDFSDLSVTDVFSFNLATSINGNGYGVAELYASAKIQFTAANTYTGQTTISNTIRTATDQLTSGTPPTYSTYSRVTSGILELGSGGSISDTSAVVNNGVLIFNRSDAVEFDKNISGTGNVVKNNTNTVSYSGTGSYTGITYINGGTFSVGSGGTTGSLTSNINNKANVTFNRSDNLTYAGIVSGTGTLTKTGAGNLTLTANQTYTGATTISAGQLVLSNNAPTKGTSSFAGPGQLVIQPFGDDFAADFSTSDWTFASTLGGLTIGKATSSFDGSGDKNVTVASPISIAGPITIYAIDVVINGGLTSTAVNGTVTLKGSGNISNGANGFVVSDNLLLLGGNVQLDHTSNNVGTIAASGVGNLRYWDRNALTIGTVESTDGITATGTVDVQTLTGDLTVAKNVSTTNTTANAVILNAGKNTAAGTASGGNVVLTGTPVISGGAGSTVKVYTGQLTSTGNPNSLVTQDQSRFRYNADETTDFTSGEWINLGTGTYVIYRGNLASSSPSQNRTQTERASESANQASQAAARSGASFTMASVAVNPAARVSSTGVKVELVRSPELQAAGLVTVSVPSDVASNSAGLAFALPNELLSAIANAVNVEATLVGGDPLPAWLRFDNTNGQFVIGDVGDISFPLELNVQLGSQAVTVVISERQ